MTDKPKEPATPDVDGGQKPDGVPVDQVTSLVDSFRESLSEMRNQHPATPAPVEPAGPSQAERLAAYEEAKKKVNEMAAGGDVAEAMEHLHQSWQELTASQQQQPGDHPALKGLRNQAERMATNEHKEMFALYGTEIKQVVDGRAPEDQINPEVWDAAIREVKAAHIDEILEAERTRHAEEAAAATPAMPTIAGGSRGRTRSNDDGPVELDAEQLDFAKRINFTPERYAEAISKYDKMLDKQGSVRLMDDDENKPITPGRF